jgi:hypothetical protein
MAVKKHRHVDPSSMSGRAGVLASWLETQNQQKSSYKGLQQRAQPPKQRKLISS